MLSGNDWERLRAIEHNPRAEQQRQNKATIGHRMIDFTYRLEHIQTDALTLDYFPVPWDTKIIARPLR